MKLASNEHGHSKKCAKQSSKLNKNYTIICIAHSEKSVKEKGGKGKRPEHLPVPFCLAGDDKRDHVGGVAATMSA